MINKNVIKEIRINEKGYPSALKNIKNPPQTIYLKGRIPPGKFLAIVGTRRYSKYGRQIAYNISSKLARAGIGIISGMAKGIDTFSHKACLEEGGKTIAVLGTGLDEKSIYPKENLQLARKIIKKGGGLISEYPSGTPGYKAHFPWRNRIISALSIGVLVVEAKKKSGALITAEWGRQQGKKVFAVPGSVFSLNAQGPNQLIRQGAKLVSSANDVLKELNIPLLKEKHRFSEADKQERLVLKALEQGALHIEEIIEQTNLSAKQACSLLTKMESEDKIRNLDGDIFVLDF